MKDGHGSMTGRCATCSRARWPANPRSGRSRAMRCGLGIRLRRAPALPGSPAVWLWLQPIAVAVPCGHRAVPDQCLRAAVAAGGPIGAGMGGRGDRPRQLAFSPDGTILATADTDGTARLWSVATQRQIGAPIRLGGAQVKDVAFSPGGKILATADSDGTVQAMERGDSPPARRAVPGAQAVAVGRFQPGRHVAGHRRPPRPAQAVEGRHPPPDRRSHVHGRRRHHPGRVQPRRQDPGRRRRTPRRAMERGDPARSGKPIRAVVLAVAFSSDSKLLAAAGNSNGFIRVWNVATHHRIGTTMSAGMTDAYGVAFTPSGKTLVTTDTDGTIRQWSVTTHHQIRAPIIAKGHPAPEFLVAALSPDGTILATTQFNGPARLWILAAPPQP